MKPWAKAADVVRARRFELVDTLGEVRASLALIEDSPTLVLQDAAGNVRAMLTLTADGSPALSLHDAAGKTRVGLSLVEEGNPMLYLRDAAGKMRATLDVMAGGLAGLALLDAAGQTRARLDLTEDGSPSLELLDENGKFRAVVGATTLAHGVPPSELGNAEGTVHFTVRSESSLVLFDRDEKVAWKAP